MGFGSFVLQIRAQENDVHSGEQESKRARY
jgi:hypothetical protein